MRKSLTMHCPAGMRDQIVAAIRVYVDIKHPEFSDECSQVARDALLTTVDDLAGQPGPDQWTYNRRLRAMVKEAIKLYCLIEAEDTGRPGDARCAALLRACQGEAVDDRMWRDAVQADAGAGPPS
jgi:hypothetical protein